MQRTSEPDEAVVVPEELNEELATLTIQSLMGQVADMSLRLAQRDATIFKLRETIDEKNKIIDSIAAEQKEKA